MPKAGKKVYAVARGRTPGIYKTWARAEAEIHGVSGARFKSFSTLSEAEAFMVKHGASLGRPTHGVARRVTSVTRPRRAHPMAQPGLFVSSRAHRQDGGRTSMRGGSSRAGRVWPGAGAAGAGTGAGAGSGDGDGSNSDARPAASPEPRPESIAGSGHTASVFFDGAARGNPGRGGWGYAIRDTHTDKLLDSGFGPLPHTTNNEAEYRACLEGIQAAARLGVKEIRVFGDSKLVLKQIGGEWEARAKNLIPLRQACAKALWGPGNPFSKVKLSHVRREKNQEADRLANQGADAVR